MPLVEETDRDWLAADEDSVTLQVAEHGYVAKTKAALLASAVMEKLGVDDGDTITVTGENEVEARVWEAEHPDDRGKPFIQLRQDLMQEAAVAVLDHVTLRSS